MVDIIIGMLIGLAIGIVVTARICYHVASKQNREWAELAHRINREWDDYCSTLIERLEVTLMPLPEPPNEISE